MLAVHLAAFFFLSFLHAVVGFDMSRNDNVVLYWGQNSYGATHSDVANFQKTLSYYCTSDSVTNTFPIAFLTTFFGEGGLPTIDLANICNSNDNATFPGTELADCSALASDIETCQAAGKIVTLSIGGASGSVGFTSDSQAQTFADTIWNLFLGGSNNTRPFGSAVLDGVDLDIEGGSSTGYAAFVTRLRSHASSASKQYYVTAAPQCPFPDASLGSVINAVGFDAVYVQFYNNYCGLQAFSDANDWDFGTWDNWAKTTSPNPSVKVYIGAPAASSAAGSGYVDAATLANILETTQSTYSSFGGVMMWDASQAYANDRYDVAAKNALTGGTAAPSPPPSTSTTSTGTTSTKTSSSSQTSTTSASTAAPTSGSCAGVAAWSSAVAYNGGAQVTYNGQLWTAKWWSEADAPGGPAGDWQDDGPCTDANVAPEATLSKPQAGIMSSLSAPSSASASASTVVGSSGAFDSSRSVLSRASASTVVSSSAELTIEGTTKARMSLNTATATTFLSIPSSENVQEGRALRFNRS